MFDEDAPETPGVSGRSNAAKPRRKKSARAQRHAARKKSRAGVTAPAADAASAAAGVPDAAAAASEAPLQINAAEPVAAAASLQDESLPAPTETPASPPPDAAAVETPDDPEALALALWEEGRRQEAVELLEREIAMERVRAGVRVLTPVEAGMAADESPAQPDATPVEPVPDATGEPASQPESASTGTVIALPVAAVSLAVQAPRAKKLPPLVDLVAGPRAAVAAATSRRPSPVALLGGAAVVCLLATGFLWADSDQAQTESRPGVRSVWPMIASVDGAGQPNVLLPESLANLKEDPAARQPPGDAEVSAPASAANDQSEQPLMPVAPNDERPAQAQTAEAPASAAEAPLTRSIVQPLTPTDASPQAPVDALADSELPTSDGAGPAALSAAEPPASVAPNGEPPAEILAGTEAPLEGDDPYAELLPEDLASEDLGEATILAEARMPRPRPEPPARTTRAATASTARAAPPARSAPGEPVQAYNAPPAPYVVPVDPYYAPALAQRRALAERYMATRRAAAERRAFWNSRIIVLRGRPYQ